MLKQSGWFTTGVVGVLLTTKEPCALMHPFVPFATTRTWPELLPLATSVMVGEVDAGFGAQAGEKVFDQV